MKKQVSDQLPVVKKQKLINIKEFSKLARRVKRIFMEEEERLEQEQSRYSYHQSRRAIRLT